LPFQCITSPRLDWVPVPSSAPATHTSEGLRASSATVLAPTGACVLTTVHVQAWERWTSAGAAAVRAAHAATATITAATAADRDLLTVERRTRATLGTSAVKGGS
jgi:hypothetical protein